MKRENNFDIVRLLLAETVVLFHAGALSGSPTLAPLSKYFSGHLAVEGFFAISGFLIFASYERCVSMKDYVVKRAARILPAYWLALLFCVGIAFAAGSFHVGKLVASTLIFASFLHPSVEGVFDTNPTTSIMNGALWTIKIEVMFYIAVPMIVWLCRRVNRDAVLWTLFVLSVAYRLLLWNHETLAVQLPGQLSFFMVGALLHYHLDFFQRRGKWLMGAAAALYLLYAATGWFVLRPLSIPTLTLGACLLLPVVKGPTRWGDFSYGTYVLHWPMLQLVAAAGLFVLHPWGGVAIAIVLVAAGAVISWFVVEKPALDAAHAHAKRWKSAVQVAISS